MLSIKELVKVYKTKGGAEVRALDGVSVDFPDKGMVFLLGKSGSGKSTLLNVAGGLDRPDRGEVIVKGKSSKNFTAADFDSYRNTYVGFVFQEYNILDEFNVEQNIALALQLQGKKNDKDAVNALLEQVDLSGLGKRKPNTLSGGQKQRVAIARALIKEPEIIMADEPTGALDSNTGKQVFDTLKKLSADKLVIVVSHDREFAEQYADRIIELKDGKIISDTSKALAAPKALSANVNAIGADTVRVKDWNKLTQDDFNQIWSMMKGRNGEVIITSSDADMPAIKRVCKIADDGSKEYFKETDRSAVKIGQYDASRTKFIKSKMPLSRAVKMGASGLKTKPVRLFFTILLSVISFAMFGVLSTMMMYDPIYSVASALENSPYRTAMLEKNYKYNFRSYSEDREGNRKYDYEGEGQSRTLFGKSEVDELNKNSEGLKFAGVIGDSGNRQGVYGDQLGSRSGGGTYYSAFSYTFSGFTDCGEQFMSDNGFRCLAGRYPQDSDEIAVSGYVLEAFEKFGYSYDGTTAKIAGAQDLIGKKIKTSLSYKMTEKKEFEITGVYDTGTLTEYEDLKQADSQLSPDELQTLIETFNDVLKTSFHTLCFVAPAFYEEYGDAFRDTDTGNYIESDYMYGTRIEADKLPEDSVDMWSQMRYFSQRTVKQNASNFNLYAADGSSVTASSLNIGENETYIPLRYIANEANTLYNAGNEYLEIYLDSAGNRHEFTQNAYAQNNGFYTNYEGDVSFTEKPGYGYVSYDCWISKSGETSQNPRQDWEMRENREYYENGRGECSANVGYFARLSDHYYKNNDDDTRLQRNIGNCTRIDAECYFMSDDFTVYLKGELPDDIYVQQKGTYYLHRNTGEIVFTDPMNDWRRVTGYYLDLNGNLVKDDMSGYNEHAACLYFNKAGDDYSLVAKEGYDPSTDYYVGKDGKIYRDWIENGTRMHGLFVSNRGELSLTQEPGYIFSDHYFKNDETGDIKFVTRYYGYWTDEEGNAMFSPYNGLINQYSPVIKKYGDYEENADYAAAFMRLAKAAFSPDELKRNNYDVSGVGEFTGADLKLIVERINRNYETWCNREPMWLSLYAKNANGDTQTLDVAGYYTDNGNGDAYILSDAFVSRFEVVPPEAGENLRWGREVTTDYVTPSDARYNYVITLTGNTLSQTHFMLDKRENGTVFYSMSSRVYNDAYSMASMIDMLKLVFLIAGAVMAVLSALMLFNFISASISAKRKEIGVLRAVGARGTDVFKIFFAEAIIIALICFVLSAVAAGVVCTIMNGIFITSAVKFSVLNYGVIQILLILGIALVVSFIATILPVFFAAKKPPVESIRAL